MRVGSNNLLSKGCGRGRVVETNRLEEEWWQAQLLARSGLGKEKKGNIRKALCIWKILRLRSNG